MLRYIHLKGLEGAAVVVTTTVVVGGEYCI